MTHWQIKDGTEVEIVNFIDDYSRAVLCSRVLRVTKAADVVRLFYETVDHYGLPASVLSDIQERRDLHQHLSRRP